MFSLSHIIPYHHYVQVIFLCVQVNRWMWKNIKRYLFTLWALLLFSMGHDLSGWVQPRGSPCLSGTQNNRYSGIQPCSSQSHSPLPIPDFYRGGAECQVQLQYHLSGIGVRSKWDSEKSEIHTPHPNHTKKQWSKPSSPGSCSGSGQLPLCTIAIWTKLRVVYSQQ